MAAAVTVEAEAPEMMDYEINSSEDDDEDQATTNFEHCDVDVLQLESDNDSEEEEETIIVHSASVPTSNTYLLFIRPVLIHGILVQAHWDAGCNCSLIPQALLEFFPEPKPELLPCKRRIMSAVGVSLSVGTISVQLCLSPTCTADCQFLVVQDLHLILIGGDILSHYFQASYSLSQNIMHLRNSHQRPESISLRDPLPFRQPLVLYNSNAGPNNFIAHHAFVRPAHMAKEVDDIHYHALVMLLDEYSMIFASSKTNDKPPCPPARDFDFTVELRDLPRKQKYRVPHNPNDKYEWEWSRIWEAEMSNSGAAEGARYNGAIEKYTGDVRELQFVSRFRSIPKHDETYQAGDLKLHDRRAIIDYREVNEYTVQKARFPVPAIYRVLHHLSKHHIISKTDIRHGFYNIAIKDEATRRAFAFYTPHGIYLPNVMPMGAKEAPDYLMRALNILFEQLINEGSIIIYMDDIFMCSNTVEEH